MRSAIFIAASCCFSATVPAQQRGNALPQVGDQLPVTQAFHADGNEFSLSELKGDYSVLVFGCLT